MTEEYKDRLREAKVEVTRLLDAVDLAAYNLADTDARLETYCAEVINNPNGHNVFEQLGVKHFLKMVDKYGLCKVAVLQFFTLYEELHFPGIAGLQKYKLTPVQAFQYASIYGFWEGTRRVVRTVLFFVPRKFSKTTSSAAISVHDVLFGDANAESYICANSADQAKKCFKVVRQCFLKLDPKSRYYLANETEIKSRRPNRPAFAQCLTANANTKDGLNASTIIVDEFSQARDAELFYTLTSSMGARHNPLTVIITTASPLVDAPCYEMVQGCCRMLLGDYEDDSTFAHIFMPDVDDDEGSEDTWRKVHPHMGVTVSMDFYRDEWAKALRNGAEALLTFRTKLLNIYAEDETRPWISATLARKMMRPLDLSVFTQRPPAMVAIDLSESDDFSAVTTCIHNAADRTMHFHTDYFFPRGALPGHPNEEMYRKWAADGHLHLTDGEVIDYRAIVAHIVSLAKRFNVLKIGYDAWKSREVINMLAAVGGADALKPVGQAFGNFTAPVESFEHWAKEGRITINSNPINAFCFGNAVLAFDNLENCKPVKRKQTRKIDGVITMLMTMRLFLDAEQ